jgi:hypothetical protein
MSLYQIINELQTLVDLADRCANDEEMTAAVAEHIAALDEALDSKAESYACLIQTLDARSAARKSEAVRITCLSKVDAALSDRLRNALRDSMIRMNKTKIETSKFRLSVVNNGGKIPLIIDDESKMPEQFKIVEFKESTDRDAIREALENGEVIEGARLGVRGNRIDIR